MKVEDAKEICQKAGGNNKWSSSLTHGIKACPNDVCIMIVSRNNKVVS